MSFTIPGMAPSILLASAAAWPVIAFAHLGGGTDGMAAEQAALKVNSVRVEHRELYDVHHWQRADGEIRQYSDAAGRVFAVSWKTHHPVPLADLLDVPSVVLVGDGKTATAGRLAASRHVASSVAGDRVVHVLKLSRLFMGSAQLSSRIPQGVDVKELQP